MKIFISGATGYLGHSLALTLAQQGNTVHILVRNKTSQHLPVHAGIRVFEGDITQKQTILKPMRGCEQVYHTAALVQHVAGNLSDFYDINVEGTRNMLEAAVQTGVRKFVFTSTCGVIGPSLHHPMSENDPRIAGFETDYDISKLMAEKIVAEYAATGFHALTVSPSKIFGPGIETHRISVNSIIRQFISGRPTFCPGNSSFISNYVFIDDLVRGHILAMHNGKSGEKYILGGENLSYREFFQAIRHISGTGALLIPLPETIARLYGHWNVLQSKLLGIDPVFNARSVKLIYCNKSFSCEKAISQIGYIITPFNQALQATIQFLKQDVCLLPTIQ